MASLDVHSLFTNITLDETINIIVKIFCENKTANNLDRILFKFVLTLASKESYFLFDGELHHHVYSVFISLPSGSTPGNTFLSHCEDIWVRDVLLECNSSYYKLYFCTFRAGRSV